MVITPVYLGENKRGSFFDISGKKKTSLFLKNDDKKNLGEVVVENALKKLESSDKKEK